MDGEKLGQRLRYWRELRGMSQSEVQKKTKTPDKLGIKREYLSKLENSELKNPTLSTLNKLAKAYDITVSILLEEGFDSAGLQAQNATLKSELEKERTLNVHLASLVSNLNETVQEKVDGKNNGQS